MTSGHRLAAYNGIVAISSGACGDADAMVATNTWTEESPLAARRALSASQGRNAMPSHRLLSRGLSEGPYNFGSNNLRFGDAAADPLSSLELDGRLKQPFYWNGAEWRKLTYSTYSLDFVMKAGGSADTHTSGSELDLSGAATVDASGLTDGIGTLIVSQSVDFEGATVHVTREYSITDAESRTATMTVRVLVEGADVPNVRVWMGTGDDYVGGTDGPTKEIGDFDESGAFVVGAGGKTIRVSTADEGVFFTTPSDGAAVQSSCCDFDNIVNQIPAEGAVTATGDGSYGIYFSFGDVTDGETKVAMAAYAAGSISDLAAVGTNLVESVAAAAPPSYGPGEMYDMGTPLVGVPGSYFKLCWGHAPTTGALEMYNIEIDANGDLAGPDVGDILRCTLGIACSPQITGHRLAASNGMVVIGSAAACGAAEAAVATDTWTTADPAEDAAGFDVYNFGVPVVGAPGNAYRLCWGFDPAASEGYLGYNVEVDPAGVLAGPDAAAFEFTCTLGLLCDVQLSGFDFAVSNGIV